MAMADRRRVMTVAAAISFALALMLAGLVVAVVVAINRDYPLAGWAWWADLTTYLVLAVPLLPALVGAWLLRRARRG
jgi:hypothetical protein